MLLQNADELFVCETAALHSLVLSMGQSLLQNGGARSSSLRGGGRGSWRPTCFPSSNPPAAVGAQYSSSRLMLVADFN